MPNHITNLIHIKDEKVLNNVINYLEGDGEVMDFNKIIPMPDYIYQGPLGINEHRLYGKDNWFDWSINKWGTKWNAYNTYTDDHSILAFDTAWSGVPKLVGILSQKFPDSEFVYKYADEDMGSNTDEYLFKNGKVLDHKNIKDGTYSAYKTYFECKGRIPDIGLLIDRNENIRVVYLPVERIK